METKLIWNQFSDALKKFILSKVKEKNIAEDILQEVFIKIHLKKHLLQQETKLKPWLFSIANNAILDYFRKNKSNISKNIFDLKEEQEEDTHSAKDCLLPLILNLPKTYKEVLLLSEIKGLKQKEVAQQLNLSLAATKSRILRGKEALKKGFIACCDYTLTKEGHLKGEHKNIEDCKVCGNH